MDSVARCAIWRRLLRRTDARLLDYISVSSIQNKTTNMMRHWYLATKGLGWLTKDQIHWSYSHRITNLRHHSPIPTIQPIIHISVENDMNQSPYCLVVKICSRYLPLYLHRAASDPWLCHYGMHLGRRSVGLRHELRVSYQIGLVASSTCVSTTRKVDVRSLNSLTSVSHIQYSTTICLSYNMHVFRARYG